MVSKFHYTPEMLAFLQTGYQEMQIPALTEAFNARFGTDKGHSAIKTALTRRGMTCGRKPGNPKGSYQIFTREQVELIRYGYQAYTLEVLTERLNETFGMAFTLAQVRSFTRNHQLKSGRTGQFVPGQAPPNKGVKGWDAGGRSHETRFQPGRAPEEARNYLPIGSVRFTRDGYMERKVTDAHPVPARRWVMEHRLVWEAANGPIPEGHVVVFLDGDRLNITVDNLRCVPRGVLQWMNKTGLNETSGEARKAAILTAELVTRANKRARG